MSAVCWDCVEDEYLKKIVQERGELQLGWPSFALALHSPFRAASERGDEPSMVPRTRSRARIHRTPFKATLAQYGLTTGLGG